MRKKPSPAGPKPLPGLTATFPFSKSIMPKSMVLIRERHGSGIGTQQNMLALGGVMGQPIQVTARRRVPLQRGQRARVERRSAGRRDGIQYGLAGQFVTKGQPLALGQKDTAGEALV